MQKSYKNFDEFVKDCSVLVVEDEEGARTQLAAILKNRYKEVYEAENGIEALRELEAHEKEINIILSDVQMPKMNGIELSREIKQKYPLIPIMLITAFSDTSYLIDAMEIGIDRYVLKPINPAVLMEDMRKVLKGVYISGLEELERQMQLKDAVTNSKTEVLRDIAHHWRNPLASVSMKIEAIEELIEEIEVESDDDKESIEQIKDFASTSIDTIQNLSKMISEFTNSVSHENVRENISIYEFLKNCLKTCIYGKDIEIENIDEKSGQNFRLEGVQSQLKLAFYHLVKNAQESHEKAGVDKKVLVDIRKTPTRGYIEVIDFGGGIDKEIFNTICEPYVSTKQKGSGYGLGLYIASKIIKDEFGGDIKYENLDKGAKFTLEFPLDV